jgi:hypothetical protein
VRVAVARQISLQPQQVRVAFAADQYGSAGTGLDQPDPPQDEGAHDALAHLSLRDQKRPKPLRGDCHGLHLTPRPGVDQRRLARQLGELAEKGAGHMGDDELVLLAVAAVPGDVHLAGQNQGQAVAALAGAHQHLSVGEGADAAEAAQPLHLGRRQQRVHLRAPAFIDGRRKLGAGEGFRHGHCLDPLLLAGNPLFSETLRLP